MRAVRDVLARHVTTIFGLVSGTAAFVWVTGGAIVVPTRRDWLMLGDSAQHYLGWAFFRDTPLVQWPLGANPKLGLEFASSIVFTDSIPLVAFAMKPFDAILPETFQYLGLWIWACFVLQAIVSLRLLAHVVVDRTHQMLASVLFVVAPVLSYRLVHQGYGHIALASHFLILGALCAYFSPRARTWWWAALACCALLVQAYFVPMVVGVWIASLVHRRIGLRKSMREVALVGSALGVVAVLSGFASLGGRLFVGDSSVTPDDFPYRFRWQPMAFVDPATDFSRGWSRVLSDQLELFGDVEGFTYLGSGMLFVVAPVVAAVLLSRRQAASGRFVSVVLCVVCVLAAVVPAREFSTLLAVVVGVAIFSIIVDCVVARHHRALIAAAALLAAYAMTMRPGIGRRTFFEYGLVPILEQFTQTFRTHARAVWVAYYLVIVGLVVIVTRRTPRRVATAVLALAVVVSVVDSSGAIDGVRSRFRDQPVWVNQLDDPLWGDVVAGRDKVITYPPLNNDPEGRWIHIEDFVQRRGMATNAGYFSRYRIDTYVRENQALHDRLRAGEFDEAALYFIFEPSMWEALNADPSRFEFIGDIDGYLVVAP